MSTVHHFDDLCNPGLWPHFAAKTQEATAPQVARALATEERSLDDLAALLSPAAKPHLEEIAARAKATTLRRFGRVIQLYVPLYLSNACVNRCTYCGFSAGRDFQRRTLSAEEIQAELGRLKTEHFEHVLLLTGEDRQAAPVRYIREAVSLCHERFGSVGVEVYPLHEDEYAALGEAGCDSLTLYQETYHQPTYERVHPAGPKANFAARLDAPARAARAGLRSAGIGALLGLADWRTEAMFLGAHGALLRRHFWRTRLSIGFPRLRASPGAGLGLSPMSEADLVQMLCALRLFFPDADLVLSTRERREFRDAMVGLGVTRMSAGSKTRPGGYAGMSDATEQFAIVDERTPAEVAAMIASRGYEPRWKDFDRRFLS